MTVAEKTAVQSALMLHPDDNVAVALEALNLVTVSSTDLWLPIQKSQHHAISQQLLVTIDKAQLVSHGILRDELQRAIGSTIQGRVHVNQRG